MSICIAVHPIYQSLWIEVRFKWKHDKFTEYKPPCWITWFPHQVNWGSHSLLPKYKMIRSRPKRTIGNVFLVENHSENIYICETTIQTHNRYFAYLHLETLAFSLPLDNVCSLSHRKSEMGSTISDRWEAPLLLGYVIDLFEPREKTRKLTFAPFMQILHGARVLTGFRFTAGRRGCCIAGLRSWQWFRWRQIAG